MTKYEKKVLVLILYSGEQELKQSLEMLRKQTYQNWEYKIFSHLQNREAHDRLYEYIMSHGEQYDIFIKLDADMVLINDEAIQAIINCFLENPNTDQLNFSVHDVMSNSRIMGLLTFSKNVRWEKSKEILFVDHAPIIPGARFLVWGAPAPLALHCPNPHPFQAFHFGAHRMLKALQRSSHKKRWIQSALQWHLLFQVWKQLCWKKTPQLAYMMLGAYSVWGGEVEIDGNEYQSKSLEKAFKRYEHIETSAIVALLKKRWRYVLYMHHMLYFVLWPKIAHYKIYSRVAFWYNRRINNLYEKS